MTAVAAVRAIVAAGIAVLTALGDVYPHNPWVAASVTALGVLSAYAVPSLTQNRSIMTDTAPKVTPEPDLAPELTDPVGQQGASLMGLGWHQASQPADVPEAAPEAAPEAPETAPEVAPEAAERPVSEVDTVFAYLEKHAARLEEMAAGLRKIIRG